MADFRMNSLGRVLDEALRKLDLADAALEARAVMVWPEIVGPQMAKASEARSFQGGALVVVTRSSAWLQELSFQKQTLLRRYRERLGKEVVKDIRLTVGPVRGIAEPTALQAPPEAEIRRIRLPDSEISRIRAASETGDPELAQAIRRALTHEAQLREWHLAHGARPCPRCGAAYRAAHRLCPACLRDDAHADAPL
jgi:predicted nucleic acid-binding Zn ribbon protein